MNGFASATPMLVDPWFVRDLSVLEKGERSAPVRRVVNMMVEREFSRAAMIATSISITLGDSGTGERR